MHPRRRSSAAHDLEVLIKKHGFAKILDLISDSLAVRDFELLAKQTKRIAVKATAVPRVVKSKPGLL